MKLSYASTSVETQSESTNNGKKTTARMTEEERVLKLLDDAITDWICDYQCDDLPGVFISAGTLEPIFATARHNEFDGSLVVAFRDGIPIGMIARGKEDSFEDLGNDTLRIKP